MTMALPVSLARARRIPRPVLLALLGIAVLAVAIALWKSIHPAQSGAVNSFYTIVPMDLDVVIRKDGELQSVKNLDVVCPVEGLNTIRTIVPEGSAVKKDDIIAELDSSDMKKKLQTAVLDVRKG